MPEHTLIGSVHGRFQLMHLQHLEYLLAAKERCDHLIIGITNYDGIATARDQSDEHRKARINNPLTYFERTQMVRRALLCAGVPAGSFSCSPFPIEHPEDLPNFLDRSVLCFTTVREAWNVTKVERLREHGYRVEVLLDEIKTISSTDIRQMILAGDPAWRGWLPLGVADYLIDIGIDNRLHEIARSDV